MRPKVDGESDDRAAMEDILKELPFLRSEMTASEQMHALVRFLEIDKESKGTRENLRAELEKDLRMIFRDCSLRIFGSSANTFGTRSSDVDAFLDLNYGGPDAGKHVPKTRKKKIVYLADITKLYPEPYDPNELKRLLIKDIIQLMVLQFQHFHSKYEWQSITPVPEAKVPILKLEKSAKGFEDVDISFTCRDGFMFQSTKLQVFYSHLDKRVKQIIFTVRKRAEFNGLHSDIGYSSYGLTMLVLFFLTRSGILPTPESVVNFLTSNLNLGSKGGCHFDQDEEKLKAYAAMMPARSNQPDKTTGELLVEFFRFYDDPVVYQNILDCYTGQILPVPDPPNRDHVFRKEYVKMKDPFARKKKAQRTFSLRTYLTIRKAFHTEAIKLSTAKLDLRSLFVAASSAMHCPPLLVITKGWCAKRQAQPVDWKSRAAALIGKALRDILQYDIKDIVSDESEESFYTQPLKELGSALKNYSCYANGPICWGKTKSIRRMLRKGKRYDGLRGEWDLECDVGRELASKWVGESGIDINVAVMVNKFEGDGLQVLVTTQHGRYDTRELFKFLNIFLPAQVRKFISL